jgi:hypothetical protein
MHVSHGADIKANDTFGMWVMGIANDGLRRGVVAGVLAAASMTSVAHAADRPEMTMDYTPGSYETAMEQIQGNRMDGSMIRSFYAERGGRPFVALVTDRQKRAHILSASMEKVEKHTGIPGIIGSYNRSERAFAEGLREHLPALAPTGEVVGHGIWVTHASDAVVVMTVHAWHAEVGSDPDAARVHRGDHALSMAHHQASRTRQTSMALDADGIHWITPDTPQGRSDLAAKTSDMMNAPEVSYVHRNGNLQMSLHLGSQGGQRYDRVMLEPGSYEQVTREMTSVDHHAIVSLVAQRARDHESFTHRVIAVDEQSKTHIVTTTVDMDMHQLDDGYKKRCEHRATEDAIHRMGPSSITTGDMSVMGYRTMEFGQGPSMVVYANWQER